MMPKSTSRRVCVLSVALVLAAPFASGDEPPKAKAADSAKAVRGKWSPTFQHHAEAYTIRIGDSGNETARMLPEPLLRWWQPVRGGDDGALYLWVKEGRPVAAMTFFTFRWPDKPSRAFVHEHHSFSQDPLEATWHGRATWQTSSPGLTFRPVPEAPAPADSATARLRQMQAIVRDFSANTIDDKKSTWPLRPLTKPLYRYDANARSVTDGALFAFAQGTDPEAFLLLEARAAGKGARWEYAVTRFTDLEIRIRLRNAEVFSGPHTIGDRNEIYQTNVVIDRPGDSPADFETP